MGFHYTVFADQGQVSSPAFIEVPIHGPGTSNLLVVVTGVASVAADEDDWHNRTGGAEDVTVRGDIFIETNYKLRDSDELVDSAT